MRANTLSAKIFLGLSLAILLLTFVQPTAIALAQESEAPTPCLSDGGPCSANEVTTGAPSAGQDLELSGARLFIYNLLTVIGAFFAWIGGFLLDVSISVFVANMAGAAAYMGLTSVVVALWEVIRDVFNLLFIFSLIWIGFQTILGTGGTDTKKWVANLLVAALLINFSLYIAQVIVDFSNVAAFQISQMMQTETYTDPILGVEIKDISSGFAAKTQLENFPKGSQAALNNLMGPNSGFDGYVAALAMGFVVMLMLIILGFVFAAGAVILFTRFIALTFLMVFSPLLFLGWIFPKMDSYGQKWLKYLINQALVGPAFIFMLYFSYRALAGFSTIGERGGEYTIPGVLVYFVIVIGFVCLSLVVAKSIGAFGADQAMKFGGGLLTRNTVGRGSDWALNRFNRWQGKDTSNQGRVRRTVGRFVRGGVALTNTDRAIINTLEAGKAAKGGDSYSLKDNKDYAAKRTARLSTEAAAQRREAAIDSGIIAAAAAPAIGPLTADVEKSLDELGKAVKGLSDSQLTEDLSLKTVLTNKHFAVHLNEKQVETLQKSGKYSDDDMNKIKDARKEGMKDIASANTLPGSVYNPKRGAEWLTQRGTDEVIKMPIEVFTSKEVAPYLTPAMVEGKLKSGTSQAENNQIKTTLEAAITDDINNNPPDGTGYTKQWKTWKSRNIWGSKLNLNIP